MGQSHINKSTLPSTLYVTVIASPWKPLSGGKENQRGYEKGGRHQLRTPNTQRERERETGRGDHAQRVERQSRHSVPTE